MHILYAVAVCASALVTLGVGATWWNVAVKTPNRTERIAGIIGASNVTATAVYAISQAVS